MEWAMAAAWHRRARRSANLRINRVAQDALDVLRVGVLVLDHADQPLLANPAARQLGLLREDLPTQHRPTKHREDHPTQHQVHPVIRALAGQVRRNGVPREVELELARGGRRAELAGPPRGVRVRVMPMDGAEHPPGQVAIEAIDVTEAHRVARVRRDFVANVSHELKTPVGALALLAETLLEASDDPRASRRFAERIRHESQRLSRLVTELLELSRLQGAEPLPEPAPVAVDRIVHEVVDRTRTAAAAKHIKVRVGGARGLTVYGDEGQLATAVANLVENAIAYSAERTVVTIDAGQAGEMVDIAVTDRGIGIAPGDLDRIFERFYRSDQARSRHTGGTGLGLAIVKHIAVNHGGRVEVDSTVGAGSTFTLRLPTPTRPAPPRHRRGVETDAGAGDG